jgi:hypothetical protein
MLARFAAVALGLLGLGLWACSAKDDSGDGTDPGVPVDVPSVTRGVADAGLIIFDMDADVYSSGGGTGVHVPDARLRLDLALTGDTASLGGAGAVCDVFATNPCDPKLGLGCYAKSDGSGTCQQAGSLPGGSTCDPSSPDSRCTPGYVCSSGLCTALCHYGQASATECSDSIGSTCLRLGTSTTVGYCATD